MDIINIETPQRMEYDINPNPNASGININFYNPWDFVQYAGTWSLRHLDPHKHRKSPFHNSLENGNRNDPKGHN